MTAEHETHAESPILRNVFALGIAQCITWVSSTVAILLMPRYLGSEDLGRYSLGLLAVAILNIVADLGGATYITKQVPRLEPARAAENAWNSLGLGLALSTGVTLLGMIAVAVFVKDQSLAAVFLIILLLVPLQMLVLRTSAALRGVQDMAPIAWSEGTGRCLGVALVAGVLLGGYGVQAFCVAGVIGACVTLIISFLAFRRRFTYAWPFSISTWKSLALGGLPFMVWQASLQIYGQIDILILSILSTQSSVGWYAAAYRLISVPIFAPTIIGGAAFPAISAAAGVQDWKRVSHLATSAVRACLVITIPMSFGMAALSPRIVDALNYPVDFDNMIPLVSILALHVPVVGVTMIMASCINAFDRQWGWVKVGIVAAIMNPVLNIPLVLLTERAYNNGAIGAAVVTLMTEALMLAGALLLLPKGILRAPALNSSARTLLAGGFMVATLLLLQSLPLIPTIVAGGVVYGGFCFLLGVLTVTECNWVLAQVLQRVAHRSDAQDARLDVSREAVSMPRG